MSQTNTPPNSDASADLGALITPEQIKQSKSTALVTHFKELDQKAEGWIKSWNPYHPEVVQNRPLQPVQIEESYIRKTAAKWFLIAFGAFAIWASFAPIDAGVVTTGTVMVSGYRKALQHPSGGVVQDILVKEGDQVKEGDVLIRINPLKAEAELSSIQLQYINALVIEARLQAERKGAAKIIWPDELGTWASDAQVKEAKEIQQKLFDTRRIEIVGLLQGRRQQLGTLSEEARSNAQLAAEGYVSKAQANQVMRSKLDAEMQLNQMQASYYKEIDNQLAEIQKNRDALKDRVQAVSFDRDLTAIRAPVSGTVVGLKVYTKGGTVSGGQVLAEIVPAEVALIVDAQVPPSSIDKVRIGSTADMRFTAFNQIMTPVIPGIVMLVGADKQPDPKGGAGTADFYLAQVVATKEGLAMLGDLNVQPGMPVDVIFVTGERTFLSLLLKPISDSLAKAFK